MKSILRTTALVFAAALLSANLAHAKDRPQFYELEFAAGATVHQALLMMRGDKGVMRVRYFSPERRRTEIVQMTVTAHQTDAGVLLVADEAIDTRSGRTHASYAPDRFLIRTEPDGTTRILDIDARGVVAPTRVRSVDDPAELYRLAVAMGLR